MEKRQHINWVWDVGLGKLAIVTLIRAPDAAEQSPDELSSQLRTTLNSSLSSISWTVDKVTLFDDLAQELPKSAVRPS